MRAAILPLLALALSAGPSEVTLDSLYRGFQNPPAAYSLSPYWFWNSKITASETRRQIGEMVKQGVQAAVIMNWAGLEPAYLSEEYWQQVGAALDAAKAAGLTLNFSDEFLWPSGQAWDWASLNREPSRVLQLHPEYRMRRLTAQRFNAGAPIKLDADPEVVVAGKLDAQGQIEEPSLTVLPSARVIDWKAPAGRWQIVVYTAVPATERGVRVDLMNPAAVRLFINLVYEEFARRFPDHLGSTIRFFVSDHEGSFGAPLPFTPALWDTFQQRNDYDLRRVLPLVDGSTPRAAEIRQDYLDTVSHLYATSFVGQVTEWCRRHNVEHGHSDIEETLLLQALWTGDMFRLWRASSAVYIDALLSRARMPIDFQEALSVAHFEGHPLMVENQGLNGHDSYWSLEKARLGTNMCLLWGVNRLIPHYFEYDPGHVQYPPSIFLTQPLWRYFHHYADVARRGLYMNAQGEHHALVAIYYPLESAFANGAALFHEKDRPVERWNNPMDQTQDYYSALQLELARLGWEYHILDGYYLQKATLTNAKLGLTGEEFGTLILPPMTHLNEASAAKIRQFAASGGQVLALGFQPASLEGAPIRRFPIRDHPLFMDKLDYQAQLQAPASVREDLAPLLASLQAPEVQVVSGSRDHLFFSHRSGLDVDWYWAVNDSPEPRRVIVKFPGTGVFEKWDAETGARYRLPSRGPIVDLEFGPWDAWFVVHTSASNAPPLPGGERRLVLALPDSGWQFTTESPVRVPYAKVEGSAEPVWLAPERLANRNWWLAGPYPYNDHQGFFDAYPPERGFDPKDPAWKWVESPTSAVRPPAGDGVYYAYVNVWSPAARPAQVAVAVADSVKVWWNGELKLAAHMHWPFVNLRDPWSYRRPIDLRAGWNSVLLKVGPSFAGPTGFLFRITDEKGDTVRDVVYSRDQTRPERALKADENAIPEHPFEFAPRTVPYRLQCWTDTELAHYSGSAIYETAFELPRKPAKERWLLDLGRVGLAAEVWLNGEKVGERAWRPYELDISRFVRPGRNELRVRVANSNAGWMAQGDPIYERGHWGVKFASERDRLQTLHPNGLEGPVRVLAE